MIGSSTAQGRYTDVYAVGWLAHLRHQLAPSALALGIAEIDASTLQAGTPRQLTQAASLAVYQAGFDGIHYRSRYGHSIQNWALFEPFMLSQMEAAAISEDDTDLAAALRTFGITLMPIDGSPRPQQL